MPNSLKQPISLRLLNQLEKNDIRDFYYYKPILCFKKYIPEFKWPQKIRKIFLDIYNERVTRAIIKAPRGGGKSQLLSAIAFALWFFKRRKLIDLGGAFSQAKIVYNYILNYLHSNQTILSTLDKPPLMQHTVDKEGNYLKCIPASQKQVRGPHPDGLLGDEICECKDELIEAALPMVDTSENPLIILTSTFHKIFGIFQDFWDSAPEKGYKRYSWDIFDIAKPFDPAIWDDERLNKEIPDLQKLKKLSKDKTGDPEGWVPINNIIQAWREKPTLDHFLVELMGERPSQAGLVTNPEDVDECVFDDTKEHPYHYLENAFCTMGIDWGFSSMTSLIDLMLYKDQIKVLLENKDYSQVPLDVIIEDIIDICIKRPRPVIYADSSGKFENIDLQKKLNKAYQDGKLKMKVRVEEVVFSTEKESLLGCYRSHFEKHLFRIPESFKTAIWQYKRYRYQEGSDKPVKKDDHIPDATLCALVPFNKPEAGHLSDIEEDEETKTITGGLLDKQF